MSDKLFVYGLLREGEEHNHVLVGLPKSGPHTLEGFALYDLGPYPAAIPAPSTITGDIYEIPDPAMFEILDRIEGVDATPPLYTRERVGDCWIYVYDRPVDDAPRIASGDWLARS